jgi:hypothetical protein
MCQHPTESSFIVDKGCVYLLVSFPFFYLPIYYSIFPLSSKNNGLYEISHFWNLLVLPQLKHTKYVVIRSFGNPLHRMYHDNCATIRKNYNQASYHRYNRSWTVTKIIMEENAGLVRFYALYLFKMICYLYTEQVRPCADSPAKPYRGQFIPVKYLQP